jgi:signal transduction histidine kinase
MRPLKLGTILVVLNVGLVTAALVAAVTAAAIDLRRLADEQALARVQLAGSNAGQAVRRAGEDLLTAARQLAEQGELQRLGGDHARLQDFMDRFRTTARLSGCAVLRSGRRVVASPSDLPWESVAKGGTAPEAPERASAPPAPGAAQGEWSLGPRVGDVPFLLVAVVPVGSAGDPPGSPRTFVVTARLADKAFESELARQIGLPVSFLGWREISMESSDRAPLRQRALEEKIPLAARVDASGAYLALEPLATPGGAPEALVEVALPTETIDSAVRRLGASVLLVGLVAGALAGLLSVPLARRLVRPLDELTRASSRIGAGDLTTPVPHPSGVEAGDLANAMEDMRVRLLDLTAELRRRRGEAEAILGGISEGVYAVDRERRIRFLSPPAARLLGVDPKEALGRFCGDVLNPQGPDGVRPCNDNCPIVDARFRGGARATELLRLKGGRMKSVVIASAASAPTFGGEKEIGPYGPGAGRQIQLIRDETELEATRRLRDDVLANITHEFRTPLSAQLASLEMLRDRLPENAGAAIHDLLASLERGALRLTQLIDNLLESVRLDAGHADIRRQPLALDEVVEEAAALTAPLLDLRGQTLEVDLPYPLPAVLGDAPRLVQVFVNLIANANKFAPVDSVIRIGGQVLADEVTLWVEDQGPGFPSEGGVLLFEPFTRSPGEEPEQSGMGLGLYIVKSIIERHGGRVEALRGPVAGARLTLTLPLAKEAA